LNMTYIYSHLLFSLHVHPSLALPYPLRLKMLFVVFFLACFV
jgi:hypothetical protein